MNPFELRPNQPLRIVQPDDPDDYVSDSPSAMGYFPGPRGGGFVKPTYANTHGERAPIRNAPKLHSPSLLQRIQAKREERKRRRNS